MLESGIFGAMLESLRNVGIIVQCLNSSAMLHTSLCNSLCTLFWGHSDLETKFCAIFGRKLKKFDCLETHSRVNSELFRTEMGLRAESLSEVLTANTDVALAQHLIAH